MRESARIRLEAIDSAATEDGSRSRISAEMIISACRSDSGVTAVTAKAVADKLVIRAPK